MIPAKSEVVDLYRLLYKADHPMNLDEIAKRMNPVCKTFAYVAWREFNREELAGRLRGRAFTLNEKDLTEEQRDAAWRWWLSRLLDSMRKTKRVSVTHKDGTPAKGGRYSKEPFYAADRDNPPYVRKQVTEHRVVPWAPELDEVNGRHVAGMQFLPQAEDLLKQPKPTVADLKKAVALAVKAIRE